MAQRKKINPAVINTKYMLVDTFIVGLSLNMKFVEKEKKLSPKLSRIWFSEGKS